MWHPLGHYVLSAPSFGKENSKSAKGPTFSAQTSVWNFMKIRPNLSDGDPHLPRGEDGLYQFDPPRAFSARKADTSGAALDGFLPDPEKITIRLCGNRAILRPNS